VAGYGRITVLNGLTMSLAPGENVGLFGPNGHGKTTLLRAISGLVPVTSGEIRFEGEPISGASPAEIVGRGVIHVAQGNRLFPNLTVAETLQLGTHRKEARAQAADWQERVAGI